MKKLLFVCLVAAMIMPPSRASADTLAPTAPALTTATAVSSAQVDLSWTPSTDNVGVTAYRIYRNGNLLATVPATAGAPNPAIHRIGLLYVSESDATYNANWTTDLLPMKAKIEQALNKIMGSQHQFVVDLIGHHRPSNLFWNPSHISFTTAQNGYYPAPTSWLDYINNSTAVPLSQQVTWTDCAAPKCVATSTDSTYTYYSSNFGGKYNGLQDAFSSFWIPGLVANARTQYPSLNQSEFTVLVMGKAGPIIPGTGTKELNAYCLRSTIGTLGYNMGSMVPGTQTIYTIENGLLLPGYFNCSSVTPQNPVRFTSTGWQTIVHEILHSFGAVDVYPMFFTHNTLRDSATQLEPPGDVDKSIMANGWGTYCDATSQFYYQCTAADPEKIYLDKHNRSLIQANYPFAANPNSYSDVSATAGTSYTYTLYALDAAGNVSPVSNSLQATTPPLPAKPTITSFTATPSTVTSGQQATLSWNSTGFAGNTFLAYVNDGNGNIVDYNSSNGTITANPTTTTTYTLTASNDGGLATSTATVIVAPPDCDVPGTGNFTGCYFANTSFGPFPTMARTDNYPIDFTWGAGVPDPRLTPNQFSVRWKGDYNFNAGPYLFTGTVAGTLITYIDGVAVSFKYYPTETSYTFSQTLTAGTHTIRVDYVPNGSPNSARAKLVWVQN